MDLLIFWLIIAVLLAGFVFTVIQSLWGTLVTLATVLALGFVLYLFFPAEIRAIWEFVLTAVLSGVRLFIEGWYSIKDLLSQNR